jgi:elongation factor G
VPLNLRPLPRDYRSIGAAGEPPIGYRELFASATEIDHTHKRPGEFTRVKFLIEPSSRTMANTFQNAASGDALSSEFLRGIEQGLRRAAGAGALRGFPVVASRATLLEAEHGPTTSVSNFEIAAWEAFHKASAKAGMKMLEPYLEIDITTPEPFAEGIIADFKSRRGVNTAKPAGPGLIAIYGFAPLANMIGYESDLKSMFSEKATYTGKVAGLEEVPADRLPEMLSDLARN